MPSSTKIDSLPIDLAVPVAERPYFKTKGDVKVQKKKSRYSKAQIESAQKDVGDVSDDAHASPYIIPTPPTILQEQDEEDDDYVIEAARQVEGGEIQTATFHVGATSIDEIEQIMKQYAAEFDLALQDHFEMREKIGGPHHVIVPDIMQFIRDHQQFLHAREEFGTDYIYEHARRQYGQNIADELHKTIKQQEVRDKTQNSRDMRRKMKSDFEKNKNSPAGEQARAKPTHKMADGEPSRPTLMHTPSVISKQVGFPSVISAHEQRSTTFLTAENKAPTIKAPGETLYMRSKTTNEIVANDFEHRSQAADLNNAKKVKVVAETQKDKASSRPSVFKSNEESERQGVKLKPGHALSRGQTRPVSFGQDFLVPRDQIQEFYDTLKHVDGKPVIQLKRQSNSEFEIVPRKGNSGKESGKGGWLARRIGTADESESEEDAKNRFETLLNELHGVNGSKSIVAGNKFVEDVGLPNISDATSLDLEKLSQMPTLLSGSDAAETFATYLEVMLKRIF